MCKEELLNPEICYSERLRVLERVSKNSLVFKNSPGQALNIASARLLGHGFQSKRTPPYGVLPRSEGSTDSQSQPPVSIRTNI